MLHFQRLQDVQHYSELSFVLIRYSNLHCLRPRSVLWEYPLFLACLIDVTLYTFTTVLYPIVKNIWLNLILLRSFSLCCRPVPMLAHHSGKGSSYFVCFVNVRTLSYHVNQFPPSVSSIGVLFTEGWECFLYKFLRFHSVFCIFQPLMKAEAECFITGI